MAYNHEYPYVDPNRFNSDWILNKIKELEGEMDTFEALNKITFDGEWDITKQYPAWCIVNTNGGTEGYISLKPVPAGVTINNIEYWTSVVNYTATIADLQNRVVALENNVGDLSQLKTIETGNLVEAINSILDRQILFIGDSYGVYNNPTYPDLIASYTGRTIGTDMFVNFGSGYGFSNATGKFITLMENATVTDPDKITDIIVLGGINDAFVLSDVDDDIAAFVASAKTHYPNAKVHIGVLAGSTSLSIKDSIPEVLKVYSACTKHGAAYITNCEYIMANQLLIGSDGVHPTQAGSDYIAQSIVNYLLNGSIDVNVPRTSATSSSLTTTMTWSLHNGLLTFYLWKLSDLPYNAVYTNQWNTITNLNDLPFNGNGNLMASGTAMFTSGGTYYALPIEFRATDQYLQYMVRTDTAQTYANVSEIRCGINASFDILNMR